MLKRVHQVLAALTAKITLKDRNFITEHLTETEEQLFWSMNLPDQKHSLNVAYTAMKLSEKHSGLDIQTLIKSALLHDVGKVRGDISTLDKIITVLLAKFAPAKARNWGRLGRGDKLANLKHAIFIYYHHPQRSAAFLKKCGCSDKIAGIVLNHHEKERPGDLPELIILRQADNAH